MIPANYQHEKHEDFKGITSQDGKANIQIIAGELENQYGRISTQTPVNAFMIDVEAGGEHVIEVPEAHQSMLYLLHGDVIINNLENLKEDEKQIIQFNQDGDGFSIKGNKGGKLLFLSGEPFNEEVTTYGPYVMNTQTEIMEAMRDYQMGKMGFLPAN